ncbi:S24 family peptidase [Swingsia samuiensis]|uniref:S24 family peptidase n=1 Tax=Swingsia samuiensis TaxID=1293412 RepID=A0A4Y6UKH3_9PROT|nr:S24 family peptidase [Swingsia samuiensis]QDH18109.1 S24 family peptidase [Swingsia samuiensis]
MTYRGDRTSGFASPASQHVEQSLDLIQDVLSLQQPSRYPVRIEGDGLVERGIHTGDILIVDAAKPATLGCVVIASLEDDFKACEYTLQKGQPGISFLTASGRQFLSLEENNVSIWAVACGLVRATV